MNTEVEEEVEESNLKRDLEKLWRRTVNEFPHISNLIERLKEAGFTTASEELLVIYNEVIDRGVKLQEIISSL